MVLKKKAQAPQETPFPLLGNPAQHNPSGQSTDQPSSTIDTTQDHQLTVVAVTEAPGPSPTDYVNFEENQSEAHEPTPEPITRFVLVQSEESPRATPDFPPMETLNIHTPEVHMEDTCQEQPPQPIPQPEIGTSTMPDPQVQDVTMTCITAQEFTVYCDDLRTFRSQTPTSDEEMLQSFEEFIDGSLVHSLSPSQAIKRKPLERMLRQAIATRRQQLASQTNERPIEVQPTSTAPQIKPTPSGTQDQGTYSVRLQGTRLEYEGLSKFQSGLLERSITPGSYTGLAQDQINQFLRPNSIVLNSVPAMSYTSQFSGVHIYQAQLTRDQIAKIQNAIQPVVKNERNQIRPQSVNNAQMRLPTFNPDFQFSFTLLFIHERPTPFKGYTKVHQIAQEDLNNKKAPSARLNEHQLEATWSYDQEVRWVCLQLDPLQNQFMSETLLFYYANRIWPKDAKAGESYGRCTTFRCGHTLVAEGIYWMVFCSSPTLLRNVYQNLTTKISPILLTNARVFLVAPSKVWPTRFYRLPTPQQYEQLIPIVNMWSLLTQNFLVPAFQGKFTACLFAGGCYMPLMACRAHCIHGKAILSMPTFATRQQQPQVQPDGYYNWDCALAKWTPVDDNQVPTSVFYDKYITNSLQHRIYGSWHFHTCWNRDDANLKVAITPNSWKGQVSHGLSVDDPQHTDYPFITQVILGHSARLSGQQKRTIFVDFIEQESNIKPEWAMRFRKLDNFIQRVDNSAYLAWTLPPSPTSMFQQSFYPDQTPGIYELLHSPPASAVAYFRSRPSNRWSPFAFIPKELAIHYNPYSDQYHANPHQLLTKRYWTENQPPTREVFEPSLPHVRPTQQNTSRNPRHRAK